MEISTFEQILEQVKKSQKILIALPQNLNADSLASGIAFSLFLKKLKKDVVVATSGQIPQALKFLPETENVKSKLESSNGFVITLNTSLKKLEELSYQTDEAQNNLKIFLKTKGESFVPADVSFGSDKLPLDLIIILGSNSLEDLGELQESSADLFFETPKINIDHKAENEYFGQVNLVDITATSVAEILSEILTKYEEQLLDEDIATCLLTGIIEKTGSFQRIHTTPKSFVRASELVALGARQQEVVKNIYKTKPLSLLKLWGRALARMKIDKQLKIVHSVLGIQDFEKSEASSKDVLPTLLELVDNLSGYKIVGLIAQTDKDSFKLFAAVHVQVGPENFAEKLSAKPVNFNLNSYKIFEQELKDTNLEKVENDFIKIASEVF